MRQLVLDVGAQLRDRVELARLRSEVVVEIGAHAGSDCLLADVHMYEARDLARAELARHALLEQPDREHRPVERELRGGVDHG